MIQMTIGIGVFGLGWQAMKKTEILLLLLVAAGDVFLFTLFLVSYFLSLSLQGKP